MDKLPVRRNSNRIPQHDYSTPGYYFVTVLSKNRGNRAPTISATWDKDIENPDNIDNINIT